MEAPNAKAAGDEAFRAGQLQEAIACYTAALETAPGHAPTLCNRSLAALKLGHPEQALVDAEAALEALSCESHEGDESGASERQQLPKAFHRKAEALAAQGRLLDCLRTYQAGLAACRGSPELGAALRLVAEQLPVPWLAKYWAAHVEAAQAPHPLSSRDGRLIRPVPHEGRLPPPELLEHLEEALYALADEARDLLCEAWAAGRRPGRAEAAFFRAAAYLHAGAPQQALKDARVALAYGPRPDDYSTGSGGGGGSSGALITTVAGTVADATVGAVPADPQLRSAWPAALAALAGAHEGLADNVPAALAMQRALELDPGNEDYAEALERLLRRIPEDCAAALQAGGAAGLEAHLAAAKEAAQPEFLRRRPKYYYYYEWMKKRVAAQYPALPEPVMDKLLALEANELDMVLQYPAATAATVDRLLGVYADGSADALASLEAYQVPLLSWEDYQSFKAAAEGGVPALPSSEAAGGGAKPALPAATGGSGGSAERLDSGGAGGCGSGGAQAMAVSEDSGSEAGSVDVDDLLNGLD